MRRALARVGRGAGRLARPAVQLLAVVLGLHALLFVLTSGMGDPARMLVGQRADQGTLESIRRELGLDQPLHRQYLQQLAELAPIGRLDSAARARQPHWALTSGEPQWALKAPWLRRSFQSGQPVLGLILQRLPATALLAVSSLLIAAALGVGLGAAAGYRAHTALDRALSLVSVLGVAAPTFVVAIVLAFVFAVWLGPLTGLNVTGYVVRPSLLGEGWVFEWSNLLLPSLTLGLRPAALIFQLTRSGVIEALGSDMARTAWAKGLSPQRVLLRHALPNALSPVLSALGGWLAALLTGAFFVEAVFDWPGVGRLLVDALLTNDYPVVVGTCLVTGVVFLLVGQLTDALQPLLDPRVRPAA